MKQTLLFLLVATISISSSAQSWEQLPMHGGGYVTGLIPHPTDENTLFARIDVAGVYKTTDAGDNWTSLTKDLIKDNQYNYYVRSFLIDADNTNKQYFISGNAPWDHGSITHESFLWMTTDNGANWTKEVAPIAFGGNGQYRNAGETMLRSSSNADLLYIAGQPTYNWGTTSWNTDAGLYSYNVNTDTWTALDGGTLADAWITSIKYKPDDNDYIYISAAINTQTNLNSSTIGLWKYQISTGTLTQIRTSETFDFIFDTGNSSKIITIQPSGIDITTNDGNSWSGVTQPFGYAYNYFITAHPTNSDHWYIGYYSSFNQSGILQTTDGGLNYYETKFNTGSNQTKITYPAYATGNYNPGFGNALSTLLFHPANTTKGYAADWYGVFKTSDAATALITNTGLANTENSNWAFDWKTEGIYNMVQVRTTLHPTDNTIFYNCLADIGLYIGSNSGTTCTYQTTHPITSIYSVRFAPSNTSIGYAVGAHHTSKGRIVKTTDGGTSWHEPSTGTQWGTSYFESNNSISVTDLQIADSDADILIVGVDKGSMSNQIYRSNDGGSTFFAWDDGISASIFKNWTARDKLLKDANGTTFYVWHQNLLYKRHLNDASWTAMTNPNGSGWFAQVIADPTNNNTLYATQYGSVIYKSTNGGSTWNTITSGANRSTALSISKNGTIAVLQGQQENSASPQSLYVSNDNGTTWHTVGLANFYAMVSGIIFLQDHILLAWSANTTSSKIDLTTILPVTLTDFKISLKENYPHLEWTTAAEQNNKGFEIERGQKNGAIINWEKIDFVAGQGTKQTTTTYQFTDTEALTGKYFYRLKQVDFDNQYEYSEVVVIEVIVNNLIRIYPNPTTNLLNFETEIPLSDLSLSIYDMKGQLVSTTIGLEKTRNTNELEQGIYLFRIFQNGNLITSEKVMIW